MIVLRKTLLTLLNGPGLSGPAPAPAARTIATTPGRTHRDPLAERELALVAELAALRARLVPLRDEEARLLRLIDEVRRQRRIRPTAGAPARPSAPTTKSLTVRVEKARRVTGTSRVELKHAISAREARLRPIVRHAMAQMAARLSRPELRHAWAMGGQAHPGLVAAARQAWTDAIPALVAALAAPLQKQEEQQPTSAQQLAEREIGALIRDLADRQLLAVQAQLATLMDQGPSDAVLGAIARATGLTANQTAAVGRFVAAQLDAGASEQTALRAAELYADRLLAQRAQLIARTEAVRYTSQLVLDRGAAVGGIVVKQWVSARDENVDAICRALDNGDRIPLDQPFTAFGRELMGPPAHPACRCVPEIWQLAP